MQPRAGCLVAVDDDRLDQSNVNSPAFEHVGMQPLGTIVRFGRGPLQLSIVPESAKRIGIRVAKDAPGLNWAC